MPLLSYEGEVIMLLVHTLLINNTRLIRRMLNSQSSGRITRDLVILIPRKAPEKINISISGGRTGRISLLVCLELP